jgi:hypothetical protein
MGYRMGIGLGGVRPGIILSLVESPSLPRFHVGIGQNSGGQHFVGEFFA